MIAAPAKYAYLDTRVSLLTERLLPTETLRRLVDEPIDRQRESLGRVGLADAAQSVSGTALLEPAFVDRLLKEAMVILRPLRGASRELIRHWLRRFELINLKTILRGKIAGWSPESVQDALLDLGPFAVLPIEELVRTEEVMELLRVLERYYSPEMIRRVRDSYEESQDLFVLEAVLDRQYFIHLQRQVSLLERGHRQYVQPLVDRLLDQINLVWLLRYRFAYGLEPPHTYFLLGPGGEHMGARMLMKLVKLDSVEAVIERLPSVLRARLGEAATATEIETNLEIDRIDLARCTLRHTRFNLARAVAFLMLREHQLGRIHMAVRGHQLNLEPSLVARAAGFREPRFGLAPQGI